MYNKDIDRMKPRKNEAPMTDDTRIALLENNIGHINKTLERIEKRFDSVDKRFDAMDTKIDKLSDKTDTNFKWLVGTMISLFLITVIASLLHH